MQQQVKTDRLFRDLDAVAADMEELVEATSGNPSEVGLRARIQESLQRVKRNVESTRLCTIEEAKNVAQSTDEYLRENIWKAIGVAGGVGLLLGAIVGFKSRSSRPPLD
jgi:ElaB/YqjD/DUF883 family membrane-anchored ribosome-binding protein